MSYQEVVVAIDNALDIWHARYGHINKRTIIKTSKVVEGMDPLDMTMLTPSNGTHTIDCISCRMAKQTRLTFPTSTRVRSTKIGEVIHLDICGPVGEKSLHNAEYFILFKDECTNFRFINFMRSREEAFDLIRKVVSRIKSETGTEVKQIWSDCGSEFTSKRAVDYFTQEKIIQRKSAPFTPAQNGFIERDNRTVMEGARSMLIHMNLPKILWAEAANTFIYLLNRSVNSNTDKTPYELYYQRIPRVSQLKVFGCLAVVKATEKKRSGYQKKLEDRGIKGIFVGYSEDKDFTFRIYIPNEKSVIERRDVVFDENKRYDQGQVNDYDFLDTLIDSNENENQSNDSEDDCMAATQIASEEPQSYLEAIKSAESVHWKAAMDSELQSLLKNKTWTMADLPRGRKAVTNKWVFKLKEEPNGSIRYKARLVARGFTQREGFDFEETFSPTVRMESIRI